MSDHLDQLREQLRDLELDAVLIRGRTEQLRDTIALIEHGTRRRAGRPRKGSALALLPQRNADGVVEPETDEEGPLPSLDDVQGILKTEDSAA